MIISREEVIYEVKTEHHTSWWTAWVYLAVIAIAELLVNFVSPRTGFILYIVLMFTLFWHSAVIWDSPLCKFLASLSLIPIIRIVGLSLPLTNISRIYWYLLVSIPLFVAVITALITLKLSVQAIGLTLSNILLQIVVGLLGLALGFITYQLVQPAPLIDGLSLRQIILAAVILLICTGFLEELIFRGILLHTARQNINRASGVYIAILYAVLQMGNKSWTLVLLSFASALLFSWIVIRTRSIVGVAIAHGLTNIMFFLVMPTLSVSTATILLVIGMLLSLVLLLPLFALSKCGSN